MDKLRVDKWLWSIRLFKTRTLAAEYCDKGRVRVNGEIVKSSRQIRQQDIVEVRVNYQQRKFKVLKLIEKRVGAELARACYEDLSPVVENNPYLKSAFVQFGGREKGSGRPTKRERREIDDVWDRFEEGDEN